MGRERDAMAPFGTLVVALLALSLVTTQGGGELVDNETDSLPPSLLQSKNTLVIVGSSVVEQTHSVFLNQLKKKAELYEGDGGERSQTETVGSVDLRLSRASRPGTERSGR